MTYLKAIGMAFFLWGSSISHSRDSSFTLSLLTLNLHGYHPTNEAKRYLEDRKGTLKAGHSHLHFFSEEELRRGHGRRIGLLTERIQLLRPDVLFFQEVGGGIPQRKKSCHDFAGPENSVQQIHRQNSDIYQIPYLACRGNIGWVTDRNTFKDHQVVIFKEGRKMVIHPFHHNPYPHGVLVEGFGIMVKKNLQVLDHQGVDLVVNEKKDRFFVQIMALTHPRLDHDRWILLANVHGGHKVNHFEQAVALRQFLSDYVEKARTKRPFSEKNLGGIVIAGDFNAHLYRPNHPGHVSEVGTVAWELELKGQFDFRLNIGRNGEKENVEANLRQELKSRLLQLNEDREYKPWATILDIDESRRRIEAAIDRFILWQQQTGPKYRPYLALHEAFDQGQGCRPPPLLSSSCQWDQAGQSNQRIDFIFSSRQFWPLNTFVFDPQNNWEDLQDTLSDHPGIYSLLSL